MDRFGLPTEDLSAYGLGDVIRFDADRLNTFDYSQQHGTALAAAGIPYDSVDATAVESGLTPLPGYAMVDWILGEESTENETFSAVEQDWIAQYLNSGGALFVSGSEIAWDLDLKGTESDRLFAETYLHVALDLDDADTLYLDNGMSFESSYPVDYPDQLFALNGGESLWRYDGGGIAAVSFTGNYTVVTAGFPLETIATEEHRAELMAQARNILNVETAIDLCAEPTPPDNTPVPDTKSDLENSSWVHSSRTSGTSRTSDSSCGFVSARPQPLAGLFLLVFSLLLFLSRRYWPQV